MCVSPHQIHQPELEHSVYLVVWCRGHKAFSPSSLAMSDTGTYSTERRAQVREPKFFAHHLLRESVRRNGPKPVIN